MSKALALIRRHSVYWAVLGAYLVGFVWSRIDGIRFDASTRGFYWQFLASDHMLGDTPAALWYMHHQPPGFNFLLAVTDFLYPENQARIFEGFYFVLGALLALMVTWLVIFWTKLKWVGLIAGFFIVLLPSTYIYGAWLHYTYLIAFLVVASAFLMAAGSAWRRPMYALFAMMPILGLFLVRSSFAWVFVLFFSAICAWWALRLGAKRSVVFGFSFLMIAVVVVLTVRSLLLFGIATQSSWSGNMLAGQIWSQLSPEQLDQFKVRNPEFRALLDSHTPFSELYESEIDQARAGLPEDAPLAYSEPFKPNGRTNWNFAGFLTLSKQWQSFALIAIREYPREFIDGTLVATQKYFTNQSCFNWVYENASNVVTWREVSSRLLLLGAPGSNCKAEGMNNFVLIPWVFLFTSAFTALLVVRRGLTTITVTYWFAFLLIIYGLVSTNLVVHAEFPRYRMEIDFLLIATGIAGLAIIIEAVAAWRRRQIPTLHE